MEDEDEGSIANRPAFCNSIISLHPYVPNWKICTMGLLTFSPWVYVSVLSTFSPCAGMIFASREKRFEVVNLFSLAGGLIVVAGSLGNLPLEIPFHRPTSKPTHERLVLLSAVFALCAAGAGMLPHLLSEPVHTTPR